MLSAVAISFIVVVLVPYSYDQFNLQDFRESREAGNIIIRESKENLTSTSSDEAADRKLSQSSPSPTASRRLRLISLDYVNQMSQADKPENARFFEFSTAVLLGLLLGSFLVLYFVQRQPLRVTFLVIAFYAALLALQGFGLPHANTKFHLIVGLVFAILLGISDFLQTLDLSLDPGDMDSAVLNGYISYLQYKHRYWTVLFNIAAATILSLLATVSFKIWDVFVVVFGESYAQRPLMGTLVVLGVAMLGTIVGVFSPMRAHLAAIEKSMYSYPQKARKP